MNTLSPEAQRAVEEAAAQRRLITARYGVRYTVILADPGARMHRDGQAEQLRACVAGSNGTLHYISADADGALHCTCNREACAHLRAYADYL